MVVIRIMIRIREFLIIIIIIMEFIRSIVTQRRWRQVGSVFSESLNTDPWAPARGEQGGQAPTQEKIRVGMANPGNFSRGLKTSWQ